MHKKLKFLDKLNMTKDKLNYHLINLPFNFKIIYSKNFDSVLIFVIKSKSKFNFFDDTLIMEFFAY